MRGRISERVWNRNEGVKISSLKFLFFTLLHLLECIFNSVNSFRINRNQLVSLIFLGLVGLSKSVRFGWEEGIGKSAINLLEKLKMISLKISNDCKGKFTDFERNDASCFAILIGHVLPPYNSYNSY